MKQVIYHIFNIKTPQLSIPLIKSFIDLSNSIERKQVYIIYGKGKASLCDEYKEKLALDDGSLIFVESLFRLFVLLHKDNTSKCLLHGLTYDVMFCLLLSGIESNWVCWGAGAKINRQKIISILLTPIKRFLYKSFSSIVVLMTGDRETLIRDFGVKNILVLPYSSHTLIEFQDFYLHLKNESRVSGKKYILLGNNTYCLDSYSHLLSDLSVFNKDVEVHCMMQYPKLQHADLCVKQKEFDSIFGDVVFFDTLVMGHEDYMRYINRCDIYMCGVKDQTGLGAISFCLLLGKKIYLTGKNYEWISSLGYKVYHIDDMDKDSKSFLSELSQEDKDCNYRIVYEQLYSRQKEWIQYLKVI